MLDDYKVEQPIAYNIVNNALVKSKISHAYLFETNDYSDSYSFVMSFVKKIICRENNLNSSDNNICSLIDNNNYLDVKVISPDGMWIKKEQITNLFEYFSKDSMIGKSKIYVINEAEKMNVQTANSLLKFLEEPCDNVIAMLITNDINKILPTIISRCQVIKFNRSARENNTLGNFNLLLKNTKFSFLDEESKIKIIDDVKKFILFFEKNKIDTIIYTKKLWHNNFKDREINVIAFELLIYFYLDVLRCKNNIPLQFFIDDELVKEIANSNTAEEILNKIDLLIAAKDDLRKNLNINLLLDKLIIDMCGDNE